MRHFITLALLVVISGCVQSQPGIDKIVGGPCEGCEAVLEYGNLELNNTFNIPGYDEYEPKMKVIGTVYKSDGKTPAPDVIVYIYQTNRDGIYEKEEGQTGWARRHGKYRGWIKTGKDGSYTFNTFRPATYPSRSEPEHIHFTVKEPGLLEYYIDAIHFTDDPLVTEEFRNSRKNRGGGGILTPKKQGDIYIVKRDIILGKNIPDYD